MYFQFVREQYFIEAAFVREKRVEKQIFSHFVVSVNLYYICVLLHTSEYGL